MLSREQIRVAEQFDVFAREHLADGWTLDQLRDRQPSGFKVWRQWIDSPAVRRTAC